MFKGDVNCGILIWIFVANYHKIEKIGRVNYDKQGQACDSADSRGLKLYDMVRGGSMILSFWVPTHTISS